MSNKSTPPVAREPNSKIAELYGRRPNVYLDPLESRKIARLCPFRDTTCDVSANRNRVAIIDLNHKGVQPQEKQAINETYGESPLPLGICSCWTKRHNELVERPWILCPKRLLTFERPKPIIPEEVRRLIEIPDGSRVGVWSELKVRSRDSSGSSNFFEYTFDYLLMQLDESGNPVGVPYIIEVMTSSTRGGGLTEHMVDVLIGRNQRNLTGVVDSVYTPNYRQVFARMNSQFVAKSEIAEKWGGRAIWVFQDVLLDYIEQTTAFDSDAIEVQNAATPNKKRGNVFAEVYKLERPLNHEEADASLHLVHHKSLRGRARLVEGNADYTSMLGLGYAPELDELKASLRRGYLRNQKAESSGWFEFIWGQDIDPREGESESN